MKFLKTQWGKLAYTSRGTGKEIHLVFHGFGHQHQDMLPFEALVDEEKRFIFIDIFYHGRSVWRDHNRVLDKSVWKMLLEQLMEEEHFTSFHLIGYSMGGKFSLLTYELFPEQTKSLCLLAPDGIKTGIWYSLTSYPGGLNPLFKNVIFRPKRFFSLVEGLRRIGIVDQSLLKFMRNEMGTRSKRAQVYLTWRVFGGLQIQLNQIISSLKTHQTPITLYLGEFDKMITETNLKRFSSRIPHIKVWVLPVGHGQLIEAVVNRLK